MIGRGAVGRFPVGRNAETLIEVAVSSGIQWSLLNAAEVNDDVIWNLLSAVTETDTVSWDLLNAVIETDTVSWNLTNAVEASNDSSWNLLNAVSVTDDINWNLLNAVEVTDDIRWDVNNSTSVAASHNLAWVINGATKDISSSIFTFTGIDRTPLVTTALNANTTPTAAIFTDTFESGDFLHTENNCGWNVNTWVTIQPDPDDAGNDTARFLFNPNSNNAGIPYPELRFNLDLNNSGTYYKELWIKAVYRLPANAALDTYRLPGGAHDGGSNSDDLVDFSQNWATNEHVGKTLINMDDVLDGVQASGTVISNTSDTVVAVMSGGTTNKWNPGDKFVQFDMTDDVGFNKLIRLWSGDRGLDIGGMGKSSAARYLHQGSSYLGDLAGDGDAETIMELGARNLSTGSGNFLGAPAPTGLFIDTSLDEGNEVEWVFHLKADEVSAAGVGSFPYNVGGGDGSMAIYRNGSKIHEITGITLTPSNLDYNGFNAGYIMGADGWQFNYQTGETSLSQVSFHLREFVVAETNIFGVS